MAISAEKKRFTVQPGCIYVHSLSAARQQSHQRSTQRRPTVDARRSTPRPTVDGQPNDGPRDRSARHSDAPAGREFPTIVRAQKISGTNFRPPKIPHPSERQTTTSESHGAIQCSMPKLVSGSEFRCGDSKQPLCYPSRGRIVHGIGP